MGGLRGLGDVGGLGLRGLRLGLGFTGGSLIALAVSSAIVTLIVFISFIFVIGAMMLTSL